MVYWTIQLRARCGNASPDSQFHEWAARDSMTNEVSFQSRSPVQLNINAIAFQFVIVCDIIIIINIITIGVRYTDSCSRPFAYT